MKKLWRRLRADPDAASTFLLSNTALLASGGLSLLPVLLPVARLARRAPCAVERCRDVLVLGHQLEGERPSARFRQRLERARCLLEQHPDSRVILLGGRTGQARRSEAAAGRDYLLSRGVAAERIVLEELSTHTLENLINARRLLRLQEGVAPVLVTSRAHLARSLRLTRGLGLAASACAAEARPGRGPGHWLDLLLEAYLLHWYHAGRCWSRLTRNRRMLDRIS